MQGIAQRVAVRALRQPRQDQPHAHARSDVDPEARPDEAVEEIVNVLLQPHGPTPPS